MPLAPGTKLGPYEILTPLGADSLVMAHFCARVRKRGASTGSVPIGAGDALRLTESKNAKYPSSWRPDGKVLAFTQLNPDTSWDIWRCLLKATRSRAGSPGSRSLF